MDLSIDAFNRLPHFEQEELVQAKASSLYATKDFGEYVIHYFGLLNFAVEVYVFTETGRIARFMAIPGDNAPSPFLEN